MKNAALMFAFVLVATGCASAGRVVILQNPETKQTVDCRANPEVMRWRTQMENCVSGYQSVGYKVVSDSDTH